MLPILTAFLVIGAPAADKAKKVEYQMHGGYFQKNTADLKGDTSHLVIPDQKGFDRIFGVARTLGPRPNFLPKNAFDKHTVLAVIKRGTNLYGYRVQKVTDDDGTLTIRYEATAQPGGGTARFASPLIVTVPKGDYKSVVFIENDKKVATEKMEK